MTYLMKQKAATGIARRLSSLGSRVRAETEDGFAQTWRTLDSRAQLALAVELERRHGPADWRTLSADDWRALYTSRYGAPVQRDRWLPLRVFLGTAGVVAAGVAMFGVMRALAPPPLPSLDPAYQRALDERARKENLDPIFGPDARRVSTPETVSLD